MTVIFTLIITIFVASFSYYMFNSLLTNSLVQSTAFNLRLISDTIASDITPILSLANWCNSSSQISRYLESTMDLMDLECKYLMESRNSGLTEEQGTALRKAKESTQVLSLLAWDRLQEEYLNSRCSVYISRIIIGNVSRNYLQIASITANDPSNIYEKITQLPYFDDLVNAPSFTWIGLEDNPLSNIRGDKMLPVIRPVYSIYGGKIGWCYISISPYLLTNAFKNYEISDASSLYLTIGPKTYQVGIGTFTEIQPSYTVVREEQLGDNTVLMKVKDDNGHYTSVVTVYSTLNEWSLSQTLSPIQFFRQRVLYVIIIVLVSLIVLSLGFGLTWFLNHQINKPLARIHKKIHLIAQGDFSIDPEIEWQNELGEIGHGINMLSRDVVRLMNKRIEDEKEKNDLEYQILQSQINPHFLYNTLNSIKWMATIQNAGGIAEMTTALARLMKTVSKDINQMHTIRDEIALLNDYFLIQKYRYGGAITLSCSVASDDLYDCRILKFTLQPMVENAIFHGIEPKGATGHIEISISKVDTDRVTIIIRDDGIGMTEDHIRKVLEGTSETPSDFFRKIGINNVKRRIQYAFGQEYGLSIESKVGEYTQMTITIPYIRNTYEKGE